MTAVGIRTDFCSFFMEILNRQKVKKIDRKKIEKYLEKIFFHLSLGHKRASFVFCDNFFISGLNRQYFGKDEPTDVIAFPLPDSLDPDYLGEVVISVEEAVAAAAAFETTWQRELLLYLIHGVLHLTGYSDIDCGQKRQMEKKQNEILDKFEKKVRF